MNVLKKLTTQRNNGTKDEKIEWIQKTILSKCLLAKLAFKDLIQNFESQKATNTNIEIRNFNNSSKFEKP